ncbi:hypothetical protein [Halomonas aestuarii]|nr:hypothetical protein [Halomonas aestuarii]
MRTFKVSLAALALLLTGSVLAADIQRFPDVIGVEVDRAGENRFHFDATLSSPYDSPSRYADAFRVLGPDGEEYGVRELLHDHANEQPFTRRLSSVAIPAGVERVTVQGRDQEHGYGGRTLTVALPGRQVGDQ